MRHQKTSRQNGFCDAKENLKCKCSKSCSEVLTLQKTGPAPFDHLTHSLRPKLVEAWVWAFEVVTGNRCHDVEVCIVDMKNVPTQLLRQ